MICSVVSADTVHLKNGDIVENAVITDITQTEIKYKIGNRAVVYTISKSDALKVVYNDGEEDVFAEDARAGGSKRSRFVKPVGEQDGTSSQSEDTAFCRLYAGYSSLGAGLSFYKDKSWKEQSRDEPVVASVGYGLGISYEALVAASLDLRLKYLLPTDYKSQIIFGASTTWGILGAEPLAFYVGYQYEKWLFELGYSLGGSYDYDDEGDDSFLLRVGMDFNAIYATGEKRIKEKSDKKERSDKKRILRVGLEFNGGIGLMNDVEYFDDAPQLAVGGGLFLRIGSEPIYFTTGYYIKVEQLYREKTADLNFLGITLATLPLMDIFWYKGYLEVPLLLNFGSGQARFSGGVLFDFYIASEIDIYVLDERVISANNMDRINERFEETPNGNMYWVVGLDLDIVRYWGMGLKLLIHNHTFGEPKGSYSKDFFKPDGLQLRLSTYLVF